MMTPTVHLNGTSRESLIEALCEASNKLDEAYRAIKQTAPNGRDWYPQGPDALKQATSEHMARLARVDAVKDEIDELIRAIDAL